MFDLFGLEKDHKIGEDEEVALLTTVHDVFMVGIIRGLLEDENIPYLVHERGTGGVVRIVTSMNLYGTDIFVPRAALERAQDLIAGLESDGAGEDETEDGSEPAPESEIEPETGDGSDNETGDGGA